MEKANCNDNLEHSIKMVELSIIIINYNLSEEVENCLNFLLNTLDSPERIKYEIIVVDNNSPDKDLPDTAEKFNRDNIRFFYLDKNVGFGQGCNFGFLQASGKYICFLNPDTIIKEDIFLPIINLLKSDTTIGIVGPRQQIKGSFFDASAGFYPNILFELVNLIGLGVYFEGLLIYLYTELTGKRKIKVDWVLGSALFISAELFKSVEGFDKDYFMFFEEVDLCKKVSDRGYKIVYYPKLRIKHIGNVTGKRDYSIYTIRTYASKNIYISKHYKSFHKYLMKILLFVQLFSQIIIWTLLYPIKKRKSQQKLAGFLYLLKNRLKLK